MKSIIASAAMILAFGTLASADPFSDVPANHWAREAVNSMAEKGIIQGFPDGSFKGNTNVTRYQVAMITAQALANVGEGKSKLGGIDLDNLEKLTVEFADELSLLGVKINSLEDDMQVLKDDVSTLKSDMDDIKSNYKLGQIDKVKLSGDFLIRNYGAEIKNVQSFHRTGSQLRLKMSAQIDENVKAVARWRMIDDGNNDFGLAGNPGAAWNGSNHATSFIDVAYLEIKDMFRFHGDFVFGRRFMTHGHGLVVNKFHDAVSYLKRCGDVDLALNAYFNRHGDNDTHNMWNINADTKYRGHDIYMGLYYMTINKDYFNSLINPGEPLLEKNSKSYIVELGAKGDLGDNGYWSYDIGGVYKYRTEFKANAANTERESGKGFILHGAINWDSKEEWAAKVAYTGVDEDASMSSNYVSFDERYVDSYENPLEDIMRDSRYTLGGIDPVVLNIEDLKVQFEYTPRNNNKHYFRVAYDLVKPKDENKINTFFVVGDGNSDSCDVLNAEYRYRLAENTRLRIGYTDYNYGSGNNKFDSRIFWTEIFSRF